MVFSNIFLDDGSNLAVAYHPPETYHWQTKQWGCYGWNGDKEAVALKDKYTAWNQHTKTTNYDLVRYDLEHLRQNQDRQHLPAYQGLPTKITVKACAHYDDTGTLVEIPMTQDSDPLNVPCYSYLYPPSMIQLPPEPIDLDLPNGPA